MPRERGWQSSPASVQRGEGRQGPGSRGLWRIRVVRTWEKGKGSDRMNTSEASLPTVLRDSALMRAILVLREAKDPY